MSGVGLARPDPAAGRARGVSHPCCGWPLRPVPRLLSYRDRRALELPRAAVPVLDQRLAVAAARNIGPADCPCVRGRGGGHAAQDVLVRVARRHLEDFWVFQVAPFQYSMSVRSALKYQCDPTAQMLLADGAAMAHGSYSYPAGW